MYTDGNFYKRTTLNDKEVGVKVYLPLKVTKNMFKTPRKTKILYSRVFVRYAILKYSSQKKPEARMPEASFSGAADPARPDPWGPECSY